MMAPGPLGHGDGRQSSEQLLFEFRVELRTDRRHPPGFTGETPAFDRILFRHQHRQILREPQIFRAEGVMVGKRMFDQPQPGMAQMIEKSSGIADPGHSVNGAAAEAGQGRGDAGIDQIDGRIAAQAH